MTEENKIKTMTYIYALIDPDTQEVRYIGKSNNPENRLINHISMLDKNEYKAEWIISLKERSKEPIVMILEEVQVSSWKASEKKWIKYYRNLGSNLTNLTHGSENNKNTLRKNETNNKNYGIYFDNGLSKWVSVITFCDKKIIIGNFDNEEEALSKYMEKINAIFGNEDSFGIKRDILVEKIAKINWHDVEEEKFEKIIKVLDDFGIMNIYELFYPGRNE